jgi:hypothetical protein
VGGGRGGCGGKRKVWLRDRFTKVMVLMAVWLSMKFMVFWFSMASFCVAVESSG